MRLARELDATVAELEGTTSPDLPSRAVLVVPLGSTEQHGPHLPLDTDTIIAASIASAAAAATGALLAPALAYGSSGEHAGFTGTLSLSNAALESVVVELVRSVDDWPGENPAVVLVNGHGGNYGPVSSALATLQAEGRTVHAWWPVDADGDAHAGRTETSLLLHLAPSLVRQDRYEAGNTASLTQLMPRLRSEGVKGVSTNGVLGDPTHSTAENGAVIWSRWTAEVIRMIKMIASPGG